MNMDIAQIEKKWRENWKHDKVYEVHEDSSKPKYYVLDMFPYPSGAGLHVGHPLGYIASDIFSRYKRMNGYNVLHPVGFDAFGLPAEQYALQSGIHPAKSTEENMQRYREQLDSIGFSFDWSREVVTCDPEYYKWTQWIFTLLFDHFYDINENKAKPISALISAFETNGSRQVAAHCAKHDAFEAQDWAAFSAKQKSDMLMNYRLAYIHEGYVNWCEELGTVLANDQIKDGVSERGGYPVVKKPMTQWYLRITSYAERLLTGLADLEWSDALKTMQANWIGRSEGAQVFFDIEDYDDKLEIYTTRVDTIFGATFMVLAPEHDLVGKITTEDQKQEITEYIDYANSKSDIDRMAEKKVTGAFTGAYATNPLNGRRIPIWISEYVLIDYGTGAIMAVPADDDRDQAFAQKFGLEIIPVVDKSAYPGATLSDKVGVMINSDFVTGLQVPKAIDTVLAKLEQMGIGKRQINYKLRDANFSRQRYWGEPFPILYDQEGIPTTLPLQDLPLTLPDTEDFKPAKDGGSPLSRIKDWVSVGEQTRETDTMPAVAGSSWYYLRYMDPRNNQEFAASEKIQYWQNVDLYVGGGEHAVAHLMYARFWHKFLFDLGYVPSEEPFKKLINQGKIQGTIESMLLDKNAPKHSPRFVSLDMVEENNMAHFVKIPVHIDFVSEYGSEHSYLDEQGIKKFVQWIPEYSSATFETKEGTWTAENNIPVRFITVSEFGKMSKSKYNVINPDDIISRYGADCFRMYEMFLGPLEADKPWDTQGISGVDKFLKRLISLFIDDQDGSLIVTDEKADPQEMKILHTAIKKIIGDIERFSFNTCISTFMTTINELKKTSTHKRSVLEPLLRVLAPFAPFISEELWSQMGHASSIHHSGFPTYDEKWLIESTVEYPICFNGKKKLAHSFASDMSPKDIEQAVLELDEVQQKLGNSMIRKVIVVPKKMVNLVVG